MLFEVNAGTRDRRAGEAAGKIEAADEAEARAKYLSNKPEGWVIQSIAPTEPPASASVPGMATADEVAKFMLDTMRAYDYFYVPYREVAWAVKEKFGDEWIVEGRRGRDNLHPKVTAAFRKINDGEFEWQAPKQRWETVAKR